MGVIEDKLCRGMEKVLGITTVDINDNFIRLGGNTVLAGKLVNECNLEGLDSQIVMMGLTPLDIGRILKEKGNRKPEFSVDKTDNDEYPMTPSMLYNFFCCDATNKTIDVTDLKGLWELNDDIDLDRLKKAIVNLLENYPGLNIGFNREKKTFIKRNCLKPDIQILDLSEASFKEQIFKLGSKQRDLMNDDMIDVSIMKTPTKSYLYMRIPHLVYDGASLNSFFEGITKCYKNEKPANEAATIFDEGNHQRKIIESGFFDEAITYYDNIYKDYPIDLRKNMKDDYSTYFMNEKIGKISKLEYKSFLRKEGLTFGILLQAAFVLALSSELKAERFSYRVFHSGRYDDRVKNLQGTEARPILMIANINKDQAVVDFLKHLQYRYYETIYYDVVPMTTIIKKYPDLDSGIIFNYRGSLLGSTDIILDGKTNSFSVLGYILGSTSKEDGHSHDIIDFMIDKQNDDFLISGNSGYYSNEKVFEIAEKMKIAFDSLIENDSVGQVLNILDNY